ncbi:MAG: hypothetical protein R2762_24860 [Bryobacteraceae bacterium]
MNIKVGAEPKKVATAAGLMVVAAYLMYTNVIAGDPYTAHTPSASQSASSVTSSRSAAVPAERPVDPAPSARQAPPRRVSRSSQTIREWIPKIGGTRPEERADPKTTDPRLRLDLLARLQSVTISGGHRSLFDFSTEPVKVPDVKIVPKKTPEQIAEEQAKLIAEAPKPDEDASKKAPPPPIPLKFYGYVTGSGGRRAFFLNGEDIFTAAEGQTVQKRYRIVRIGATSAEVLDTEHDNKQTIQIEPEPAGS